MKKLRGSLAAKITAIVLLCLLVLTFVASVVGAMILRELGAYTGGYESARQNMLSQLCRERARLAAERVVSEGNDPDSVYSHENFRFQLYDPNGELLYSNYDGERFQAHVRYDYVVNAREQVYVTPVPTLRPQETPAPTVTPAPTAAASPLPAGAVTPTPAPKVLEEGEDYIVYAREPGSEPQWPDPAAEVLEEGDNYVVYAKRDTLAYQTLTYRVEGYIPEQLNHADEIQNLIDLYAWGYSLRYMVYAIAAVSLLLGVLLFVFLCTAAGHRDAGDTITPNFVDKIPFDLFTLVVVGGECIALMVLFNALSFNGAEIILGAFTILAAGLLFLLWCMSLATRVKLGNALKSCLCYRLLCWCGRGLKGLGRAAAALLRGLPLVRRWVLVIAAVLLGEFFLLALFRVDADAFFLWALEHLILTALALYLLLAFHRLRMGAKAIAGGNERCEVDERYLIGELKDHADDLNHIRDGLSAAVAERVKSERFRTELITNVSHDIKTPLTSIVNYVDLLAKEEPESEKVREYVEVLSRQSARLKKLIDDLIEASKASTGSLPVEKKPCELGVLLDQTAGEYGERLAAAGLELVLQKPEKPVTILADGRHMWRIFDNLMLNVVKYSQPGTRVYLGLEERDDKALVTFRNISRSRLNISGDELMERFVRGDSSRNTEGSGLGLSIARSLAQLQGGELALTVDGDLFKVTLTFDTVEQTGAPQAPDI